MKMLDVFPALMELTCLVGDWYDVRAHKRFSLGGWTTESCGE